MSFTGLKTINATDINNQGEIRLGTDLESGTAGQVIKSQGQTLPAIWANETATAVPNPLTMGTNINLSSGNTSWDGSIAETINATDTDNQLNLTEGNGISITNTGGFNRTIALNADGTTLSNNVGSGQAGVLKVPNTLTITDSAGTSIIFDGSVARTITINDNQLSLVGGTNINITTTGGLNRTINLDSSPTNLNLTDTSNIVSPYFFHNIYDPVAADLDALTTSYSSLFLSNVNQDIVAQTTSLCVELLSFNYGSSSNRLTYVRLTGKGGVEFSNDTSQGGYGTGTRNTERLIHGMDETDKQIFRITWFIEGLTIGNTYSLYPQAKTSSTINYIAAGGSYPATILRAYHLPSTGI